MAMAMREADELEQALVLHSEVADGLGLQIEDADHLVLDDERDRELGADVGVRVDVVLLRGHVFYEQGFALECGLAGDAAAEFDAHPFDLAGVADLEAHAEVGGAVIDEQDGEDLVVDDGADEVCNPVH